MRRPALALLLGCLLLVAGASALDGYEYYQTIEYAGCDQEVYQQDIVIHRTTGTAYNETAGGLEVWHIYVGDHCREDYGDIRFVNSTGELAYYLWPDYDSSSARFAVRLEGADSAGEIQVRYGNTGAATTSDGDATYEFFDHFAGTDLDSEKWDQTYIGSHTKSVSDSVFAHTATGAGVKVLLMKRDGSTVDFAGNYTVTARVKNSAVTTVNNRAGIVHKSSPNGYVAMVGGGASTANVPGIWGLDDGVGWGAKAKSVASGTWYTLSARHSGSSLYYREGSDSWTAAAWSGRSGATGLELSYASGVTASFDYVLVRAYSAAPPAALTFSGEQSPAAPPATAFTATPLAGLAPLTVQFTDTSTGSPTSWAWTFGDGGTSSEQNPQHTYTTPRLYTVTLNATNEYGSDAETKTNYITVYGPVSAQFTANITGGTAPVAVQFTDRSTGGPTSWAWSFGDGNTSADQNPVHTYTTAGTHTVTLTASHPYSSDTETKTAYITVAVLQPFPGLPLIPRDLAGTGLYTDINGNNRLDYNDLIIFFQHLTWAKTAQPTSCFDFNGNGWLDYNDVITLFATITEEHP